MVALHLRLASASAVSGTKQHCFVPAAAAAAAQQISLVDLVQRQRSSKAADSTLALSLGDRQQLAYELQEASSVLDSFATERGRAVSSSPSKWRHSLALFMVYYLHCRYRERYSSGRELTTVEIREAMQACLKEQGDKLLELERPQRMAEATEAGTLEPRLQKSSAASFCIEVLGLEVDDLPRIAHKRRRLLQSSVENVLDPNRRYLESLGIQRSSWRKIILVFPHILGYSTSKVSALVDFLVEDVGIPREMLGKILTRFPHLVGYSVEKNLRPSMKFLQEFGVQNVAAMVMRCPQIFGLSLELNIKPTLAFFQDRGFTQVQLSFMLSRFPQILSFSSGSNLTPKWEFFLTTERSMDELVDFPQYFSYKLETRIKSRHSRAESHELRISLNRMLTCSGEAFDKLLLQQQEKLRVRS